MEYTINVKHRMIKLNSTFENFTTQIENLLGRFDAAIYQELGNHPKETEERLKKMAGEEGLMLFDIQDHGKLLTLVNRSKKAKQYVLGNPLIALQMTQHDIRAGLYAPLRFFVYEWDEQSIQIEYDLPSSLFGQFNHSEVTKVAESLDSKLEKLIEKAYQQAV